MVFGWFDAKDAKEFGESLAHFYVELSIPDKLEEESSKTKKELKKNTKLKTMQSFQKMQLEIARFRESHTLNVYQKAKLGNAFKWTLKDKGYSPVFVDQLTKELIRKL